jgi:hypothetical protein
VPDKSLPEDKTKRKGSATVAVTGILVAFGFLLMEDSQNAFIAAIATAIYILLRC